MPVLNTHIFGNLPVEIELDNDGEIQSVSVDHVTGRIELDLSGEELYKLQIDNGQAISDCMADFRRDWKEQVEYDRAQARREK